MSASRVANTVLSKNIKPDHCADSCDKPNREELPHTRMKLVAPLCHNGSTGTDRLGRADQ